MKQRKKLENKTSEIIEGEGFELSQILAQIESKKLILENQKKQIEKLEKQNQ